MSSPSGTIWSSTSIQSPEFWMFWLLVGAEAPAERTVEFVGMFAVDVVVAVGRARCAERALAVEGAERFDVDHAGDGVGVHVRRQRLGDDHRTDQPRGDVVELDLAAIRLGGGRGLAVEGDVEQLRRDAAHREVTTLALVVDGGDARQPADGLGDVLVGQAPHVVGADRVHLPVRIALVVDRRAIGRAAAGDLDPVQVGDLRLGIRRRRRRWRGHGILGQQLPGHDCEVAQNDCRQCIAMDLSHGAVPPEDSCHRPGKGARIGWPYPEITNENSIKQ
jgi:hypothetical protein